MGRTSAAAVSRPSGSVTGPLLVILARGRVARQLEDHNGLCSYCDSSNGCGWGCAWVSFVYLSHTLTSSGEFITPSRLRAVLSHQVAGLRLGLSCQHGQRG